MVGEAGNGDEVPKVVERTKPDVLLLDLKMPKGDVVQNLLDVGARSPATRVMILTAFSDEENVLNAAKGGAKGYVPKGVPSATLLQAIKVVYGGGYLDRSRKSHPGKPFKKSSKIKQRRAKRAARR